ncbi:hypothetical protein Pcinc_021483 [Petrolisthes cinctipes]|uniref:Uncharacterized protein n=1 Tax=Petrolisthes cinctipes TaxID=88211 RepID=A0AAE1FHK5_PETCI|nr:hypothetical protein Pcinc_021483 [Petrolisthes cinctipes]
MYNPTTSILMHNTTHTPTLACTPLQPSRIQRTVENLLTRMVLFYILLEQYGRTGYYPAHWECEAIHSRFYHMRAVLERFELTETSAYTPGTGSALLRALPHEGGIGTMPNLAYFNAPSTPTNTTTSSCHPISTLAASRG